MAKHHNKPKNPWRPISTAPRDGTPVLLWHSRDGAVFMARWTEPSNANFEIWCVDDRKFGPYAVRGYIESDLTHWMELPPGPEWVGYKTLPEVE